MKNHRLLLLIPFLVLASCNNTNKEISKEEADVIIDKIVEKFPERGPAIFTLTNKGEIGKDEGKYSVDLSYYLEINGYDYYAKIKGHDGDKKFDAEFYYDGDDDHTGNKFVRYFDEKQNGYVKAASTVETNKDHADAFTDLGVYRPLNLFLYYSELYFSHTTLEEGDTLKYYSSKEGQLTFQYDTNYVKEVEEEVTATGRYTYKFENYQFISVDGKTSSNYGNKWETHGEVDRNSKVKITLPSDWQTYLKYEA